MPSYFIENENTKFPVRYYYSGSKVPELHKIKFRDRTLYGYWMDNDGYIYSTMQGYRLKKLSINYSGEYPSISLCIDNTRVSVNVHRLVCETFHKKPLAEILTTREWASIELSVRKKLLNYIQHADRYQVNHIDHDKQNFHPSNLEWVTVKENQQKYQEYRKKAA